MVLKIFRKLVGLIDLTSEWSGRIASLLIIPLVAGTVYDVFMRYFFRAPTRWAYEVTWMEYAALFVLGGAYTLKHHSHIRVDIFFNRLSPRGRAIFDSIIYLTVFFPLFYILLRYSVSFAYRSWLFLEVSTISYWMPPIYPIKAILPLGLLLFAIQGISELSHNIIFALRGKEL